MNLWGYLESGGKRAYEVAHRRWGKDDVCLNWTARAAFQKTGNYWHMLPEASQARKAIWKAVNPHTGRKRIDEAFPLEIRKTTNDTEMFIEFVNGSTWQVLGSDNYNSQVGSAPLGIVFSEWALADPAAWPYMQPILEENDGWGFFITTPRGRNHASSFFSMAQESEDWFAEKQTVDDTNVFSKEQLDRILKELVSQYGQDEGQAKFEQEYYCSFDAALPGAYYGREMNMAEKEGRICPIPPESGARVYPVFDFGIGQSNSTSIGFAQVVGKEPRMIDYHEDNTGTIEDYGRVLKDKDYFYGPLILPHDAGHNRLATGMSYAEQFERMGFDVIVQHVTPDLLRDINITRQVLGSTWIDSRRCQRLIECLRAYHREWDDKNKVFKRTPKHDWASHGSDMFRGFATALKQGLLYEDDYYEDEEDFEEGRSDISGY